MRYLKTGLKWLMALIYIALGINHFVNPGFYLRIMPDFIPAHEFMVAASGVAEIVLGVGLLIPATQVLSAWGIVAMLVAFFLVHGDMIARPANYPGVSATALWVRFMLQFVLIAWAWWYTRVDVKVVKVREEE
jgi:uncharacterized membrane protein